MSQSVREKIIDKAAELLERQGYHATGLNQIVQESGTPRGSLYYYFPEGKEELAAEAVRRQSAAILQHIQHSLAATDDPAEAVYQFVLSLVQYVEGHNCMGGAPLASVTLETASTSEQLRETCRAAYQSLRAPFEQRLVASGCAPARAAQIATLITAAVDGAIILCRAEKSAAPLQQVAEELRGLVRSVLP